tara:strand:+ start:113 stop:292 length:180 start_codon:yes stop_codon:yes gene_type:complete
VDNLKELLQEAIQDVRDAEDRMAFEFVNDNDGSYSLAKYEYNEAVSRANSLFLKLNKQD